MISDPNADPQASAPDTAKPDTVPAHPLGETTNGGITSTARGASGYAARQNPAFNGQAFPMTERELAELTAQNQNLEHWNTSEAPARRQRVVMLVLWLAIALSLLGWGFNLSWLAIPAAVVATVIAVQIIWRDVQRAVLEILSPQQRILTSALIAIGVAGLVVIRFSGLTQRLREQVIDFNWDAIGATGEVIGAIGQILIAILAVYVAWRQYVISKDLTIQQNLITQQQTIDSYFQGISELVLDEEGLLEDWPQERAIAEGRTAAILSSVDGDGKAKVLRFLSRSRLLTPLKRDALLGRPILDGRGGYEEDRYEGVRVIDLGIMLAAADLAGTDLRWTDLSDINLIRANLRGADLVRTNLSRTILCDANLSQADLMGTRFFYGSAQTASPRSRTDAPDYRTGACTGSVVENADFTNAQRMSEEQRYYCCAWGGSKTRATIPGGCDGIPNKLGR
ncbi:MAG TPA: pentapeptide repeat-containing protein [Synechococcales cyanobacterium M55_K2018_004]|nr:pentapeptide repeat-containing protein [Synechococcales cyanobacterium M55_K2018_004]